MEDNIEIVISETRLDHIACLKKIEDPAIGGIVSFIGTVRNHHKGKEVIRLEFEAYEKMAISEMRKIGESALQKFDIDKILIHHRTGVLDIGEIPVIIIVGAAHRKDAFRACEFAIDTLKETVPIWKHEFYEDGDVWVAAHP
jgi:molybdopterin synthase catalytic subunit